MRARRPVLGAVMGAVASLVLACSAPVPSPATVTPVPFSSTTSATPTTTAYPHVALPEGRRLHVTAEGDDGASGTAAAPLRTIQEAASRAEPGTTVLVGAGTYPGAVRTQVSGTVDRRIAFVSETKEGARIEADDSAPTGWRNDGAYVDIVGFEISGTATDGLVNTASYVRIIGNEVHGFGSGNCISTGNAAYDLHDIDVIGNVAHNCGRSDLDHGIYVGHPRGLVTNNLSFDNAGFGIHCWHNCNELVITNNVVFHNGVGGIVVGQGDAPNNGSVPADGFLVANNIAVDNASVGIVESGATGPNNLYENNIVHANGQSGILLKTGSEKSNFLSDPGFVDYEDNGSGDYRLTPSSPGLDRGTKVGAPPMAIDGTPRPQGAGPDIGAYER